MARAHQRIGLLVAALVSLSLVAACDPGGSPYPEYGSQTTQTQNGTGVTVSGSARVGAVYRSR
ncbi:hypothetical protein [Shimia sediminis]|uniref:hypothetical protein n=1 Tax=Shimia sediminis TaxID=2497945 RepID=UPI000F8D4F74|nr:hypothetical protein [Shimia sediminis]